MDALHKGDRVKVVKFGLRLSGRTGIIQDQHDDGKLHVVFGDGDSASFDPSDLEIVVAQLQNPD
jgi:hypothetical protein